MNRLFREVASTVISGTVIIGLFIGGLHYLSRSSPTVAAPPPAESMVKITAGDNFGSGVHIGNGLILTAAHVVEGSSEVTLKLTDRQIIKGDVLWTAKRQDIALVRAERPERMAASSLNCRAPIVGEDLVVYGNPLVDEGVRTYGKVSTLPKAFGAVESVFTASVVVAPGNSGGPVFDAKGDLIGIAVGVLGTKTRFASMHYGIAYVVPGRVVCDLLARD